MTKQHFDLKVQETKKEKKRHLAQIRALRPRRLRWKRCQGRMDVRVLCSIILGVEPEFSLVIDWEGCNLLRRLHAAPGGGGYPGRRPVRRARNLVHIHRRVWSEFPLTGWDDCQSAPGTGVNISSFCSCAFLKPNDFLYTCKDARIRFSIQSAQNPGPPGVCGGHIRNRDLNRVEVLKSPQGWPH